MSDKLQKSRRSYRGHFTRAGESLLATIADNRPKADVDAALKDLQAKYESLCAAHDKVCEELDDSGNDIEQGYMISVEKEMRSKRAAYSDYVSKIGADEIPNLGAPAPKSKFRLQTEKSPLPKFSGDLTSYHEFKNDFQYLFRDLDKSQKREALYALKQCLNEKCRHWVMGEIDYDEAWRTLDKFFGDPRRVSDAFLGEIMKIRGGNEGPDKLPELYHLVKRANLTLKMVNKSSDLDNSTTIAMIERKFSQADRIRWAEMQADGVVNSNLRDLLFFMERQIWIKKNSNSEIRNKPNVNLNVNHVNMMLDNSLGLAGVGFGTGLGPSVSGQCWYCGKSDHYVQSCGAFAMITPDERLAAVKDNRICYFCLRRHSADCKFRKACIMVGESGQCKYYHHPLLHGASFQPKKSPIAAAALEPVLHGFEELNLNVESGDSGLVGIPASEGELSLTSTTVNAANRKNQVMLPVINALAANSLEVRGCEIMTLLDSGSQISLIRDETARKLGLNGDPTSITIGTVGCGETHLQTKLYTIYIQAVTGGARFKIKAVGIPRICDEIPKVENVKEVSKVLQIPEELVRIRGFGNPDLLIGVDFARFHTGEVTVTGNMAIRNSPLGPVIFGPNGDPASSAALGMNCISLGASVRVAPTVDLTEFWTTESMGVTPPHCECASRDTGMIHPMSVNELKESQRIRKSARKINDQWLIPIPWAKDPDSLPDNYVQVLAKLKSLERRLLKSQINADVYHRQIEDLLERGCARKMTKEEIEAYKGPVFYISHFAVYRYDNPSTPVRIVFNAASPFQGHVLNDYQIKGPDLLNSQLAVLTRFRDFPFAVMSDIAKMYHQVRIDPVLDANVHRFLWRNYEDREPDVYQMTVLTFGDKCSPALANTALDLTAESFIERFPEAAETILKSRYMDDVADSYRTKSEARARMYEVDRIMASGHFRVKKWVSNFRSVVGEVNNPNEEVSVLQTQEKVLGIAWNLDEDTLKIVAKPPKILLGWNMPVFLSKRHALSVLAGVYDVFGFLSPFIIRAKIGMQDLWRRNLNWDEDLPRELKSFWLGWFSQLSKVHGIKVDRCVTPKTGNPTDPLLLICCDASQQAFGAVAYIRWTLDNGKFQSNFVISKARVAPLKELSMPRLELQAALVSARLLDTVSESRIEFTGVRIFTDSMIVLAWLQSDARLKPFCTSRITEILSKTEVKNFYHIPTEHNSADDISRGLDVDALNGRWMTGPSFFSRPEEEWPCKQTVGQYKKEDFDREVAKKTTTAVQVKYEQLPDVSRCGTWKKLIRVRAYVRRFVNYLRTKKTIQCDGLTLEEKEKAKMDLIICAQRNLTKKQLCSLGPKKNEKGVIVASPRTNQMAGYEKYEPPILPKNAKISELIVAHVHKYGHPGVANCGARIRRQFWIIGVHKLTKKVKFRCVFCREMEGKTELQLMADLPPVRLQTFSPPFHNTALDYFGPIRVRFGRNKTMKVYGVLFTCLSTRAVYIDVATDYATAGLMMVLRRFFTIRGYPKTFWSDRGTNLVGADVELRKAVKGFDLKVLKEFCHERDIEWFFFTPTGAHQNGCAESLIKSCKRALRMAIGEQRLTQLELQTVCFEVGNLLNSRPIGRLPNDPSDGQYISPNDLLLGRASTHIPQGPFDESHNPRRRLEFCQRIVDTWWKKWYRDVFPNLTPRRKWRTEHRNVKVGDFVLVKDPNPIRGTYTKGIISETFPGRDGRVRNVSIKTVNGTYERPITRIVVIQPVDDED